MNTNNECSKQNVANRMKMNNETANLLSIPLKTV